MTKSPFESFETAITDMFGKGWPEGATAPFTAMLDTQAKNFAAWAEANQMLASGAGDIVQRHMSLMQERFSDWMSANQAAMTGGDPQKAAQKSMDAVSGAFQKAMEDMNEIISMASSTGMAASEKLQGRLDESMKEFQSALDSAKPGKGK